MQYLGGKSRIAKKLAAKIHEIVPDVTEFWDPFCGGLSMSVALSQYGRVVATDACAPLIALYEAVRAGWDPPQRLTREAYAAARGLLDSDPLKAFAGFGCSFGGKWFGGYSAPRPKYARPAAGVRKVLLRDVPVIASFAAADWLQIKPAKIDAAIYLDPPYRGTTGYGFHFDFDRFIDHVRAWSEAAPCFISEYDFPLGEIVWEGDQMTTLASGMRGEGFLATERLYYVAKGSL